MEEAGLGRSITVICSTLGRKWLQLMVGSFLSQSRTEFDRLWVYGDGWEGEEWLRELEPVVRFRARKKGFYYGHSHLVEGMREVTTSHYTFIGDDDAYTRGAFREVRPELSDVPLVTGFRDWEGRANETMLGFETGRICVGGWQIWFPREVQLCDFSTFSDAQAVRDLEESGQTFNYQPHLTPVLFRTRDASKGVLEKWVV